MAKIVAILLAFLAVFPASAAEKTVSVGDVMLRVDRTECLPNVFGKCDIFGRTRTRGYTDIRYMGLAPDGRPVFRRRDVDVLNNETTMSRSSLSSSIVSAQPYQQGALVTGVTAGPPKPAQIETLPPDTVEFAVDLRQTRTVTLNDQAIDILDANSSQVRFNIR